MIDKITKSIINQSMIDGQSSGSAERQGTVSTVPSLLTGEAVSTAEGRDPQALKRSSLAKVFGMAEAMPLREGVCRCLMSKEKILNLQYDPTVPASNDGSYWCVHTQTVIGPDGKVAEPETCQSGRSCYDHDS